MGHTLLIRADASPRIGAGHVMRCLALAQAWQNTGGQVVFVCAELPDAIERRLVGEGLRVGRLHVPRGSAADAAETAERAKAAGCTWIVADGYCFHAEWQQHARVDGLKLLLLDDCGHAGRYHADIVLNPNLSADASWYEQREPRARLLLGSEFALLRREFTECKQSAGTREDGPARILVTLGGADPDNVTARVIESIGGMRGMEVKVVAGASNPNRAALETLVRTIPGVGLIHDVPHMPDLMAWADLAVAGAGSTSWEMAYMGLPAVQLVLADNQVANAAALAAAGVSLNLGVATTVARATIADAIRSLLADPAARQSMSQRGRALVDGQGARRVCTALGRPDPDPCASSGRVGCGAVALGLRHVTAEDCWLLWQWANDPAVRANAFHPDPIDWATHTQWFARKQSDPSCRMYVGVVGSGERIGQIRFDCGPSGLAEVHVSVSPCARGRGMGTALIRRAVQEVFATTGIVAVQARVKSDNRASVRAFENAGFHLTGTICVNRHPAVCLEATREADDPLAMQGSQQACTASSPL